MDNTQKKRGSNGAFLRIKSYATQPFKLGPKTGGGKISQTYEEPTRKIRLNLGEKGGGVRETRLKGLS